MRASRFPLNAPSSQIGSDRLRVCVKRALSVARNRSAASPVCSPTTTDEGGSSVSILWIILIIVLVLLLLGFFSRGRW